MSHRLIGLVLLSLVLVGLHAECSPCEEARKKREAAQVHAAKIMVGEVPGAVVLLTLIDPLTWRPQLADEATRETVLRLVRPARIDACFGGVPLTVGDTVLVRRHAGPEGMAQQYRDRHLGRRPIGTQAICCLQPVAEDDAIGSAIRLQLDASGLQELPTLWDQEAPEIGPLAWYHDWARDLWKSSKRDAILLAIDGGYLPEGSVPKTLSSRRKLAHDLSTSFSSGGLDRFETFRTELRDISARQRDGQNIDPTSYRDTRSQAIARWLLHPQR